MGRMRTTTLTASETSSLLLLTEFFRMGEYERETRLAVGGAAMAVKPNSLNSQV